MFVSDNKLVAAGYDKKPSIFDVSGEWKFEGFIEKNMMTDHMGGKSGGTKSLMAKFE